MFDSVLDAAQDLARSPTIPWKEFMIGGILFNSVFRNVARYRQIRRQYRIEPSPAAKEAGLIDNEGLQKAQRYERAKLSLGIFDSIVDTVLSIGTIYFSVPTKVWSFWTNFGGAALGAKSVLFLTNTTISTAFNLLDLPFSLYETFGVEQNFGFNKQSVGGYLADRAKSLLLSLGFGGAFNVALQMILKKFGRDFIPYAMIGYFAIMAVLPPVHSLLITPLFNKKEQLAAGKLRTRIEELATSHGFPNDRIMVIDSSAKSGHSNAYFSGLPWFKEIVLFDTLISEQTEDGVIAVLAHELGHWKRNHVLLSMALMTPNVLLSFVSWLLLLDNKHFQRSMGFPAVFPPNSYSNVGVLLYNITEPFELLYSFTFNAVARRFEYEADEFAAELGLTSDLRESLKVLAKSNLSAAEFDPMYATLNRSHPSPLERLERLDELTKEKM